MFTNRATWFCLGAALFSTCILPAPASAKSVLNLIATEATVVAQDDCPIKIKEYHADTIEDPDLDAAYGVVHGLLFRNEGPKLVVAVRLKIIAANPFRELIGVHDARHMTFMTSFFPQVSDPSEGIEKAFWLQPAADAFTFRYGFAFVDKIAFSDGTVWTARHEALLQQLKVEIPEISPEDLQTSLSATLPVAREYLEPLDLSSDTQQ